MNIITGKTILITGASRGIGASIARELAKQKATVIGVSRSQQGLDRFCAEIDSLGGRGLGIPFDISNLEQLPTLLEKIEAVAGSIDILINNAGIEIYRAFQDYSFAEIHSTISINLLAAMELTRLVLPNMLARGSGHIVNITSLASKKGQPYDSAYSASKAGLLMWSDALRQELVDTGVRISNICPGYISDRGMFADTGIPAPRLLGTSKSEQVAKAVVRAIEQNKVERILNRDPLTETALEFLFAIAQFFPRFGDVLMRWLGVTKLNRMKAESGKVKNYKS
jgi:short-subunit dehydrogenase